MLKLEVSVVSALRQEMPLDVLAQEEFLSRVEGRGGTSEVLFVSYIVWQERYAVAVVGRRWARPRQWQETLVVLRADAKLFTLEFVAPEATADVFAPVLERVMRTLTLELPEGEERTPPELETGTVGPLPQEQPVHRLGPMPSVKGIPGF